MWDKPEKRKKKHWRRQPKKKKKKKDRFTETKKTKEDRVDKNSLLKTYVIRRTSVNVRWHDYFHDGNK